MHDLAEEQISHCKGDHVFGDIEAFFVVADEASISRQPADGCAPPPSGEE
jgi:hypothetical protein